MWPRAWEHTRARGPRGLCTRGRVRTRPHEHVCTCARAHTHTHACARTSPTPRVAYGRGAPARTHPRIHAGPEPGHAPTAFRKRRVPARDRGARRVRERQAAAAATHRLHRGDGQHRKHRTETLKLRGEAAGRRGRAHWVRVGAGARANSTARNLRGSRAHRPRSMRGCRPAPPRAPSTHSSKRRAASGSPWSVASFLVL